jgi:hypothetical protein
MSRPSFKPTEEQRKLVRFLAARGSRQEHIAALVGIRSPKTLRKHFRKDIANGFAEAATLVTASAYKMAVSGDFPGMTRFWLSTVGRDPAAPFDGVEQEDPGRDDAADFADAEE